MGGAAFSEENEGASCRTYLVACPRTREAALVDPVLERVPAYLEKLRAGGWTLRYALDTHTHADHLSGVIELAAATGARTAGAPADLVDVALHEGDELRVGDVRMTAWATPGHTADSLLLLLRDPAGPRLRLLTGDTLLIGATGRTDLPTGDAEAQWHSLQRLRALPDETLVFPAHDYACRSHSTLGDERRSNPRLQLDHAGFIALMTAPRDSKPQRLAEALAYNTDRARARRP